MTRNVSTDLVTTRLNAAWNCLRDAKENVSISVSRIHGDVPQELVGVIPAIDELRDRIERAIEEIATR